MRTVSNLGCRYSLGDLDVVHVSLRRWSIETFNISLESTQNKQLYGPKITCTRQGFFKAVSSYSCQLAAVAMLTATPVH